MSSMVGRAEVEEAIWKIAGRTPWPEIEKVMKVIDAYAVTMARKLDIEVPEPPKRRVPLYLCRACGRRLPLGAFGEEKALKPSVSYSCLSCQS